MNKLEEYFEQDCGKMDKNRPPFNFYVMGYNRAQLKILKLRLKNYSDNYDGKK